MVTGTDGLKVPHNFSFISRHLHLEEGILADNQSLFTQTFAQTLLNILVQELKT